MGMRAGRRRAVTLAGMDILLACLTAALLPGEIVSPDADAQRIRALAARPEAAAVFSGAAPRELFHEVGDDNVVSIAVLPDSSGDGVPEVAAGWDISKTGDNLTLSSGAGFLPGQLVWGLETADGISGGYFGGQETVSAFLDVTGDGFPELIACTGGGGRSATVYDGTDGTVVQSFDTYLGAQSGWVYDAAVVGDVNGNGTPDFCIGVGSLDDAVYLVDGGETGHHHTYVWRFAAADVVYGVETVGDVDGDGVNDVVVGEGDTSDDLTCLSGASGAVLWHANLGANCWSLRACPDADGDGVAEVAVATWQTNAARLYSGRTGALLWAKSVGSTLVQRVVVLDDVDADGWHELGFGAGSPGAVVLRGRTGDPLWSDDVGSTVWSIDPVEDVTGDGIGEVAFGDFAGITRLADGATGSILWSHSAGGHKVLMVRGAPDLDGDGRPEVLAGAQQLSSSVVPLLFVLDADSGLASGGPELVPSGEVTLGATLPLALSVATPGDSAWYLLSLDPALVPLSLKGTLALDPALFFNLFTLAVPAGGALATPLPMPSDAFLDGTVFFMQTFVLDHGVPKTGVSSNRVGVLLTL